MEERLAGIEKLKKREWDPKKQKKVLKLGLKDIIYFENFYFSLGLVLALNILYVLISFYEYTILSLICMLFSVNISCFVLYRFIISITGKEGWVISKVQLQKEDVGPLVEHLLFALNRCIDCYVKLIEAKNYKESLLWVFILFVVSRVFGYFSDLGLLMLFLNGVLVVPFLLDTFDMEVEKVTNVVLFYVNLVMQKVHPALKIAREKGEVAVKVAKDKGTELVGKGKVVYEAAKEKGIELVDVAKEKAEKVIEKGKVAIDIAKEKASEVYEIGKEKVGGVLEGKKEK